MNQRINDGTENSLSDIIRWYRYNSQVRKKYLKALSEIPKSKLSKKIHASFPTILQIFVHVLDAYRWWFIYVMNDRLKEYKRLRTRVRSLAGAEALESEVDSLVMRYVEALRTEDLKREILWHDYTGEIRKISVDSMLHHMIEEELQHRGEMNAVLWEMNIEPPITPWHETL